MKVIYVYLINSRTAEWNIKILNIFFDLMDISIIQGISIYREYTLEKIGWFFRNLVNIWLKFRYWVAYNG